MPNVSAITGVVLNNSQTVYTSSKGQFGSAGSVYSAASNAQWSTVGGTMPDSGAALALALGPNNDIFSASSGGHVYLSTGAVPVWQVLGTTALTDGGSAVAIALNNSASSLYVGSSNGGVYAGTNLGDVYMSASGTAVWQPVSTPNQLPDAGAVASLLADTSGNIYVGSILGDIYRANVGTSANWTQVGGSTPDGTAILALTIESQTIYAGSTAGSVYVSMGSGL